MNQNKSVKISLDLAQATLNYLAGRPYAEVFQLIGALQQAEEIPFEVNEQPEITKPSSNKKDDK